MIHPFQIMKRVVDVKERREPPLWTICRIFNDALVSLDADFDALSARQAIAQQSAERGDLFH